MKKKLLMAAGILICLIVGTLGTLTYFTAEDKAHNVITSGAIDIELHEWTLDSNGEKIPYEDVDGIMPDDVVSKIVEIENIGSNPAWVRIAVDKAITFAEEHSSETPDLNLIILDIDTENWILNDGFYHYKYILEPGEVTTPLFETVTFDASMGNKYMKSTIKIDVTAYATQSANNGTTVLEAAGWPAP